MGIVDRLGLVAGVTPGAAFAAVAGLRRTTTNASEAVASPVGRDSACTQRRDCGPNDNVDPWDPSAAARGRDALGRCGLLARRRGHGGAHCLRGGASYRHRIRAAPLVVERRRREPLRQRSSNRPGGSRSARRDRRRGHRRRPRALWRCVSDASTGRRDRPQVLYRDCDRIRRVRHAGRPHHQHASGRRRPPRLSTGPTR